MFEKHVQPTGDLYHERPSPFSKKANTLNVKQMRKCGRPVEMSSPPTFLFLYEYAHPQNIIDTANDDSDDGFDVDTANDDADDGFDVDTANDDSDDGFDGFAADTASDDADDGDLFSMFLIFEATSIIESTKFDSPYKFNDSLVSTSMEV